MALIEVTLELDLDHPQREAVILAKDLACDLADAASNVSLTVTEEAGVDEVRAPWPVGRYRVGALDWTQIDVIAEGVAP